MKFAVGVLKVFSVFVLLMAAFAFFAIAAPAVNGQTARERPLAQWRTGLFGGSGIGASVRDVDAADIKREKLQGSGGVAIEDIQRDGPAARAGFKAGDILITFDSETVRSARQFARLVEDTPGGREVAAVIVRDGQKMTLKVTPEEASGSAGLRRALEPLRNLPNLSFTMPRQNWDSFGTTGRVLERGRGRLGVGVQDLTDQLGDYFGTKSGALVTSVDEGTPAKAAGVKAGDVIIKINDQTVRDSSDLRRRVFGEAGDVTITVVRDRKELTLKAKIS